MKKNINNKQRFILFLLCMTFALSTARADEDPSATFSQLQQTPLATLTTELANTKDPVNAGWIRLVIINKQYGNHTTKLVKQLKIWRAAYPTHPGNQLLPDDSTLDALENAEPPAHIALLLPMQGPYSKQGQAIRDGFLSAYYASEAKANAEQTVAFYDTSDETPITDLYQKAIKDGANLIVGPLTKNDVQTLSQQTDITTPTLALNYSDQLTRPTAFYEFGLSSNDEAYQAVEAARDAGLSNAIIIAADNAWGQRSAKALKTRWNALGGHLVDHYYFAAEANLNEGIAHLMRIHSTKDGLKLTEERRHDFDVIFLLAEPNQARSIVPLLKFYYVNDIPIYATSAIYSGIPAPQKDSDLNGVTFCDIPWLLNNSGAHLAKNLRYNRLYAVGHDAYLISTQLPRLNQLAYFPLYGATGILTLNRDQQIYRYLPWTTIHDGHI